MAPPLGRRPALDTTLQDVAALRMVGMRVVLVHGGGKHITALLDKLQVPTRFENGYRVTDEAALEAAEMALSAQVNKAIVRDLARLEVSGVGISGKGRRAHHRPWSRTRLWGGWEASPV